MGTLTDEKFRIEQDFKWYQNKGKGEVVIPDHAIRVSDNVSHRQAQQQLQPRYQQRPYLRRYHVDEYLHLHPHLIR